MGKAYSHSPEAGLHGWLPRVWLSRGLSAWALRPVAALYAVVLRLRQLAYRWQWARSTQLPVRVIVVGNVVAGGAG